MSDISSPLNALGAESRRLLLGQLLEKKAAKDNSFHPLSHGQKALWVTHQIAPDSAAYNVAFAVRIRSRVESTVLQEVFQALTDRHPVLRTTYLVRDGQPFQEIHGSQKASFEVVDAAAWEWDELKKRVLEDSQLSFDLEQGPVMRVKLFTRSDQDHVLLLTIHHIACDGWSLRLLLDEFQALYTADVSGTGGPLPGLDTDYADFVQRQTAMLKGAEGERLLSFWRERLGGDVPVINLPADFPRPAVQTYVGASHLFRINEAVTARIKKVAQAEGSTMYAVLLAAFMVMLHRAAGQKDIMVGSPTSGRSSADFDRIVGYFVNPIVLRADLSGDPTFKEVLIRIRSVAAAAFEHQEYPFPLLVEKLKPGRDASRSPLFQVVFTFQRARQAGDLVELLSMGAPGEQKQWGALTIEAFPLDQQEGQFDLTLEMIEGTDSLLGNLKYNTDLFHQDTISRMAKQLAVLLEAIDGGLHRRISDLPLLTEDEKWRVLVRWNDTRKEYPKESCIHELFETVAAKTPDALAITDGEGEITYGELNARANQLAHYLMRQGVGPEVLVGICFERSADMAVGILGILKAGGAYVPLDPVYPRERLEFMLTDASVSVLLIQQKFASLLPKQNARMVSFEGDGKNIARESVESPKAGATDENLAYIMYTSGSTGRPKGICITHRAIKRLICNADYVKLEPRDRIGQLANTSFDASTFELWGALLSGSALVIVPRNTSLSPREFVAFIREQRISALFLTTALFNQIAGEIPGAFISVRHLLFGGEAVNPHAVRAVLKSGPPERLLHVYGPTESTTFATWHPVTNVAEAETTVPIGRPLANTQTYLLDPDFSPVPIGVPGELYIGGDGLSRGYLNRPELTAEKFIPSPFSAEPGSRIYRTGDLARWLPDGTIEFLGRIDHQVKVRGFRIELPEIESALVQHPSIREAAVIVREDVPGDKRITAYVVCEQGGAPASGELRAFLKEKLPDYMVPSFFLFLEALPLTPNGKVDRRLLPAREGMTTVAEKPGRGEPRTATEAELARIWAKVLRIEHVGVHDNFFDLGGHSLLATQVVSRIREKLNTEVPLRELFESPTVAELAERIGNKVSPEQETAVIRPVSRDGDFPLSFAQQRLWFLDQMGPENPQYNVPAAVLIKGDLDSTVLERCLNEIIRRHESLRTVFSSNEGAACQKITPLLHIALTTVEVTGLPVVDRFEQARRVATEEARRPFELARGPLIRAVLYRLAEQENLLLLTMHHIVSDGWSMGVLTDEMMQLYKAFSAGQASPLAALPIQYGDFSVWQRNWLTGDVLERQLAYWRKKLAGDLPLLELPTDRPRAAMQTFAGATRSFTLSGDLIGRVHEFTRRKGATLFMVLLAAFKSLLHRWTGQTDIIVGSPIANRTRRDIERLIGFFVNTLALRTDISDNPPFRELVGRIKETTLGAYAHQDMPFELLVQDLQPTRDLSRPPLFQVLFVLQNAPAANPELQNLILEQVPIDSGTSKFDLSLTIVETDHELQGSFEYNCDLFDAATIARMEGHFKTLLDGALDDPERRLSDLPLLTAEEQRQVLNEWNDTRVEYPRKCVHELFEEQAKRTPEAVSVVAEDENLSYQELNVRANKLAQVLRNRGAGPEKPVAVCMERSTGLIVGMLGILKAGGAYVPLDPAYPKERLTFMLRDSGAELLVTQEKLRNLLPDTEAQVICLDTDREIAAEAGDRNPSGGTNSDNLAYIIYTSGSTGKPKGAAIQHSSAVVLLQWAGNVFEDNDLRAVFASTSICFDLSVFEIFLPLSRGGRLILGKNALHLPLLPAAKDVTLINTVPSAAAELLKIDGIPPSVTTVNLAGEPLQGRLVRELFEKTDVKNVVNLYGPTEDTTYSTFAFLRSEAGLSPTIGRPIANTEIYILDRRLNPVPAGVHGEIYIGGHGLARGYLKRPELTAEKFVPNPFSGKSGARLYRTGDLGRYLPDGTIDFLGRIDHQVKIRGFRIELGEIEAALGEHPGVKEAVVTAHEDTNGDKRLVGYIVYGEKERPAAGDLRIFLGRTLPDYMIPSAFVFCAALPLTPNGKIDRKALPAPGIDHTALSGHHAAPRDSLELDLVHIWEDVLGVSPIGVHDNFFDLGGHSLMAVRLMADIRKTFNRNLPLSDLFRGLTIENMANLLRREDSGARETSCLVRLQPKGAGRAFFCIHPSGGNVLCYYELARRLGKNRPFYALQALPGRRHVSVKTMASEYLKEMRSVQPAGPYSLGGWSFGGIVAFEMAQQLSCLGEEVDLLALIDIGNAVQNPAAVGEDEADILPGIGKIIASVYHIKDEVLSADLQQFGQDEQLNYFLDRMNERGLSIPRDTGRALIDDYKHHLELLRRYEPGTCSGRITLFRAAETLLDHGDGRSADPTFGWKDHSVSPIETHIIPGDHWTILKDPGIGILAEKLKRSLESHEEKAMTAEGEP